MQVELDPQHCNHEPDEALEEDGGVVVSLKAEPVLARHNHALLQQLTHSLPKSNNEVATVTLSTKISVLDPN